MPGARQIELLKKDAMGIQAFLGEFDVPRNGEPRYAIVNDTAEFVAIRNFPLPDGFSPDYVDILINVLDYPATPPVGLYILERSNAGLISQIRNIFNVMNHAAYSAPSIPGYSWICWHFEGHRWRYNTANVTAGDNLRKFLIGFFNRLDLDAKGRR